MAELRNRHAWQRPELRDDGDRHRPVGWVELFFDLVFVVIIAVLARGLEDHLDARGLVGFAVQFVAVFWVWNGFTYYTERFESEGLENRLFTFLGILTVAGLAIWGEDGLGENYAGFFTSYLLARGLNIAMWLRAGSHERRFRPAAFGFAGGFALAALILVVSLFVDEGLRVALWSIAIVVDIASPAVTGRFQVDLPRISRDKFPERFGLFTLIVLGETIASVIRSVAAVNSAGAMTPQTILDAAIGLLIGFGVWWIYFDFVARRPTKPAFYFGLLWVYLHLFMLGGIVVVGVGISEGLLSGSEHELLEPDVAALLLGALALVVVVIGAIELVLAREDDEPTHPVVSPTIKFAVGFALAVVAVSGAALSTTAAFSIGVVALAIPAAYGARVSYRQPSESRESRT